MCRHHAAITGCKAHVGQQPRQWPAAAAAPHIGRGTLGNPTRTNTGKLTHRPGGARQAVLAERAAILSSRLLSVRGSAASVPPGGGGSAQGGAPVRAAAGAHSRVSSRAASAAIASWPHANAPNTRASDPAFAPARSRHAMRCGGRLHALCCDTVMVRWRGFLAAGFLVAGCTSAVARCIIGDVHVFAKVVEAHRAPARDCSSPNGTAHR